MKPPKQMTGLWNLKTPASLLGKLHHDYERMRADPTNPYPAYDFFVTAYHMHEWCEPTDKARRETLGAESLVMVAGEIATRAKHFIPEAKKWLDIAENMESTERGPVGRTPMAKPTALRIILEDSNATPLGLRDVTALQLATCLIERWTHWVNRGV